MNTYEEKSKTILDQASLLKALFQESGDQERIGKIDLFAEKIVKREYTIGFAGHFSAGKSSMVNALAGEELLPTSPIPTSANIIKVKKSDENYALVHFSDGRTVRFSGEYELATVKALGKDGGTVSQIEIGHMSSNLPADVTFMDTPGVDSTDDAHRVSTESSLHLADIVFYVMDYNHVQSELNFQFTKQLMKYNPNVYLIVNQIDKHREDELSFETFKEVVANSFSAWGVEPKGIFYTSLKEKEFPENDFPTVRSLILNSFRNLDDEIIQGSEGILLKLKDEHLQYLEEVRNERYEQSLSIITEKEWEERSELIEQYQKLSKQVELLSPEAWVKAFEEKRIDVFKKTSFMNYELRELLRLYMEAKQPDFKVGLLFSGKKTEEERNRRLQDLYDLLKKEAHSNMAVHVLDIMKTSLKEIGLLSEEKSLEIGKLDLSIPIIRMEEVIGTPTVTTGETVLNMSERLTEAVKKWMKDQTDQWKSTMAEEIAKSEISDVQLNAKVNILKEKVSIIQAVESVEDSIRVFNKQIQAPSLEFLKVSRSILSDWLLQYGKVLNDFEAFNPNMIKLADEEEAQDDHLKLSTKTPEHSTESTMLEAMKTANVLKEVSGFGEIAQYLENKAERLQHQEFTIALFGAFSAGKSSFSNALLGSSVLPVSPNPTTATITRIKPVKGGNQNETADVTLKTVEQMTEDVSRSFAELNVKVQSLEDAFAKAPAALNAKGLDEKAHIHKAFVSAFQEGYPQFKEQLGTVITTGKKGFESFVAEEKKSCFVDVIDFYYDCELTRTGVTLVDTPGADSINARHTGVAFEYIKNADAILFITYYNHAFARADREFLIQLGRVKDAFELDKMFFVVNAIDLASSAEEAEEVKGYVRSELQRFGIRFPKLYGVSSLRSLHEKMHGRILNEEMEQFQEDFLRFLSEDLRMMAVQSLHEETEKAVERLETLIRSTEENLKRKEDRLEELNQIENTFEQILTNIPTAAMVQNVERELSELLYYVVQRVYYRYPDFFREAYYPGLFSRHKAQQALEIALKEVLQMLSFDFEQEMRVTNLRIGRLNDRMIGERFKEKTIELKELNPSFTFPPYETSEQETLNFQGPFKDVAPYQSVRSTFRNSKAFFEQNEREKLKEALEALTKPDAEAYVDEQKENILEWSQQWLEKETIGLNKYLLKLASAQISTERELLNEGTALDHWKEAFKKLNRRG
ncbi:dynamin family protein [Chungangia koreensis]|uniref:Dynamin family protein n=1 Tax=Chungangia koreensis TaxID=752657 RepID=A0ABV8X7R9_9LACT